MITIERSVPILIKSGNQLAGRHWAHKKGYRDRIFRDISWFFLTPDVPKDIFKKHVIVEITRVMPKGCKKYDDENFSWGLKPVFDFLKQNGWIYEDSPKWVTRRYNQVRAVDLGKKDVEFGIIIKIMYPEQGETVELDATGEYKWKQCGKGSLNS
ncbi:MAG: hypothetical protein HQK96_14030 [Nitrospirae bacterium]|nr:hypothetical protein [Nitrospirota bacterium]